MFRCEAGQLLAVVFLRGLCRADRLPAVSACSGLVQQAVLPAVSPLPCPLPFSTFLPLFKFALPRSVHFALPPVHFHVRQDRREGLPEPTCLQATSLQAARLSRWQQQRGSAVAARAPCCVHHTITGAARLPVGSRPMETAFGQPAKFPTPAFHEPETACEQPGSLLTFFSSQSP